MFDLIAAVTLTATAAALVAVLATTLGATPSARTWIATALGAWFLALLAAGATDLLDARRGLGIAGFALTVAGPITVLSALVLGTQAGRARIAAAPLALLVGSQTMRVLGLDFVLLYAAHRLPAPFAPVAGWGDILVGALAPLVAMTALRAPASARPAILAWNALGILDLVAAIGLGAAAAPGPTQLFTAPPDTQMMTSVPWIFIPCFLVPINALVHLMIFAKLRRPSAARPEALAAF